MIELNKDVLNQYQRDMVYHDIFYTLIALVDPFYIFKMSKDYSHELDAEIISSKALKPKVPISDLDVYYTDDVIFIKPKNKDDFPEGITHFPTTRTASGKLIVDYNYIIENVDIFTIKEIIEFLINKQFGVEYAHLYIDISIIRYLDRMVYEGKITKDQVEKLGTISKIIDSFKFEYDLTNFPSLKN